MLNKLLQSIGIGSAKVDTVLFDRSCTPGGAIEGEVRICGGSSAQDIETIDLAIMTDYEIEVDDHKVTRSVEVSRMRLTDRFTVQAGQELVMPLRIPVPLNTPASLGKSRVWVQTGLDIKSAVDPQDRDLLDVVPHPLVAAFLSSAERLGFRLHQVDSEKAGYRNAGTGLPFVQEFEFKPVSGEFRGRLDELEAVFSVSEAGVNVMLQVDRRVRGLASFLSESMGMDESYTGFFYAQADLPRLDALLADAVKRYC